MKITQNLRTKYSRTGNKVNEKNKFRFFLFFLLVFFKSYGQSNSQHKDSPPLFFIEQKKNNEFIVNLRLEGFAYVIEPQIYIDTNGTFSLTGVIYETYPKTNYDTLCAGIPGVELYMGKSVISHGEVKIIDCKLIGKSDCMGKIQISFNDSLDLTYLVLYKNNGGYSCGYNTQELAQIMEIMHRKAIYLHEMPRDTCR